MTTPTAASDAAYRRRNGIYYTPDHLANLIADWAIRSRRDTVLDTSYGGCAFLTAALNVLRYRGSVNPGRTIYGVDIDPSAWNHGTNLIKLGVPQNHLHHQDFFTVWPGEHIPMVTVLLGNPPYVRHHMLDGDAQARAQGALEKFGLLLSKRASYWAYFVLYGIQFIARGGRAGLVLPRAILSSTYAAVVRETLANSFERVRIISVAERLFEATDEDIVLVLAENRRPGPGTLTVHQVNSVAELLPMLAYDGTELGNRAVGDTKASWQEHLADEEALSAFADIKNSMSGACLGDLATIRIGAVTGANKFFIIDRRIQDEWGIDDDDTRPIVSHVSQLGKSLVLSPSQLEKLLASKQRIRLISPRAGTAISPGLGRYLEAGQNLGVPGNYKCRNRTPWYIVFDRSSPDAFFTYMSWVSPRIILNPTGVDCTNAIHRLTWTQQGHEVGPVNIALGMISSITHLSAETLGRAYGGGVLKLEPGAAKNLWIPLLPGDQSELYGVVSGLLEAGKVKEAVTTVDDALIGRNGHLRDVVGAIRAEATRLRDRRMARGR